MTLIMAWREQAIERVWVATDSRLSNRGTQGTVRLTDAAAKLLSVPVVLRRPTPMSVLGTPVIATNLAFAYAGSSLIAMHAYAAVLPLWSHLQTSGPERLPSIRAFAEHLCTFIAAYTRSVSSAYSSPQPSQCALIGYDTTLETLDGWMIEAGRDDNGGQASLRQMNLRPGEIEIFGSGAGRVREELAERYAAQSPNWHREPLEMIRAHLNADQAVDVGGGVQLGYVQPEGFQLLFDVQPIVPGHQIPVMRFRGFDFSKIGTVGDAFVNLPGMS